MVVEISHQLDRICTLTGNLDIHKLSLPCITIDRLLTGTHFTMALPVDICSPHSLNVRHLHNRHSLRGHNAAFHPMGRFLLCTLQGGLYHIVRAIDGSLPRIGLDTYRPGPLHRWEEVVAGIIVAINGEVGTRVADDMVVGTVGSITGSNSAFRRQ